MINVIYFYIFFSLFLTIYSLVRADRKVHMRIVFLMFLTAPFVLVYCWLECIIKTLMKKKG